MKPFSLIKLLVLCIAFPVCGFAEDAKDWITKMNKTYADAKSLSMDVQFLYYKSAKDPAPSFTNKGMVKRYGACFYSDFMGQITLLNDHCSISLDRESKQIWYHGSEQKSPKNTGPQGYSSLLFADSAMLSGTNLKLLNTEGAQRKIEIIGMPGSLYSKIQVVINAGNFTLEEITYWYNPIEEGAGAAKVTIEYTNIQLEKTMPDKTFSEKEFVISRHGQLVAAPAWAGFHVTDITTSTPQ